jgi:putative transposase
MVQKKAAIVRLKGELWERFSRLIPVMEGPGRRPTHDQECFEGILYLLRTGCHWSELPKDYPAKSTVHDALTRWTKQGLWQQLWQEALVEYDDLKGLDWEWLSADSAMTKAPLGGEATGKKSNRSR